MLLFSEKREPPVFTCSLFLRAPILLFLVILIKKSCKANLKKNKKGQNAHKLSYRLTKNKSTLPETDSESAPALIPISTAPNPKMNFELMLISSSTATEARVP
mgnify:CR=1 FL=1